MKLTYRFFIYRLAFPVMFAKLINILNDLVDIISFDISSEGFSLITIDGTSYKQRLLLICNSAAHVFLIEIVLHSRTAFSLFEWYDCPPVSCVLTCNSEDKVINVAVKVDWLHRIFKNIKQDDTVSLQVLNDDELEIVY